jgi:hypothetical protein
MSLLRIEGNHLLAPVVIRVDEGGRELLVVMSSGTKASEVVAERRFHFKQTLRKLMAAFIKKIIISQIDSRNRVSSRESESFYLK